MTGSDCKRFRAYAAGNAGIGAVLVAALAVFLGGGTAPAAASFPGSAGRLIFSEYGGGSGVLSDIAPRSGVRRRLTRPSGTGCSADLAPDYSPDGRWVTYVHTESAPCSDRSASLWVMRADGSGAREIAPLPYGGANPAFSPDGRQVAVVTPEFGSGGPVATVFEVGTGAVVRQTLISSGRDDVRLGGTAPSRPRLVEPRPAGHGRRRTTPRLALRRYEATHHHQPAEPTIRIRGGLKA